MQSKIAKVAFISLIVLAGLGFLYLKKYGPDTISHNDSRKIYEKYVKAEATIVKKEANGRVGKAQATIWTLQYADQNNNPTTNTIRQNTTFSKDVGEKIIIYYNPENPSEIADENDYNEIMH